MLKKLYRFHGHNSLNFVHSKGKSVRSGYFQLKYTVNKKRTDSRLAVVVAKKVSKSAPTRNRIRRRVYETVRQHWAMLDEPHDMVIMVFDEKAADMPSAQLNRQIVELLTKAGLYKA